MSSSVPAPHAPIGQPRRPVLAPRSGSGDHDRTPATRCSQSPDCGDQAAAREAWDTLVASGLLGERGRIRVSHNKGASYPARYEYPVAKHPTRPAACYLYDERGLGRMLVADFDAKRHEPWQTAADAAGFRLLIERCGGASIEDLSPAGGRHIYVPFTVPLPFALLRQATEALHLRMSGPLWHGTFDKSPMMNATDGLIRPPGSAHPRGGFQSLLTPLTQARQVATRRNGQQVWNALLTELSPELEQITSTTPVAGRSSTAGGQRHDLPPYFCAIARTGSFDPARYPSRSEARLALLRVLRYCGWTDLDEVIAHAGPTGPWVGLGAMYAKYVNTCTRRRQWERDWVKAALPLPSRSTLADGARNDRHNFPTRLEDTPPAPSPAKAHPRIAHNAQHGLGEISAAQVREWGFIRCALQAVYMAEACGRWDDRAGQSARLVLRAVGHAAMLRASRYIAFGTRFLGLDSLLDRTTVGHALRRLREEDDPFLILVERGRGLHGDLYQWRIPDQFARVAAFANPLAGRIDVIHPVFRELGVPAAVVYEALDTLDAMPAQLARTTRLSASAQRAALRILEQVGLAERGERGWHRGSADPGALARSLGADQAHREIAARWATERAAWQSRCAARVLPGVHGTCETHADWTREHDDDLRAWRRAVQRAGPPPQHPGEPPAAASPNPAQRALKPPPQPHWVTEPRSTPLPAVPLTAAVARDKSFFDQLPALQRAVLRELYRADQAAERDERAREAAGEHSRKASQWRALEITGLDSALTAALAALADQPQIDEAIDALERSGLLESSRQDALFGARVTVRISRRARALVRAGLGIPQAPRRPPGLLSEGLWRCLHRVATTEPKGLPREKLWDKAPLHLAEGVYHRPGKHFIELGDDRHWHLTPAGDEHIERYREAYLNCYGVRLVSPTRGRTRLRFAARSDGSELRSAGPGPDV